MNKARPPQTQPKPTPSRRGAAHRVVTPAALREPGKPTLKTIAQISGLAVATVSRALSDAPDIKDETKATVRRIAREIGYVPNRAGVRLRSIALSANAYGSCCLRI